MSKVFINGLGAVSPGGWGVAPLIQAIESAVEIPRTEITRPGWPKPLLARTVPKLASRPAFLAHPRLRRSSPVAHYTLAAATEALGPDMARIHSSGLQVGIVYCVMSGCVQYSRRFFDEVLRDPSTASPLVFPETVFNAPASHLSAFLGSRAENYTLVGDCSAFIQGLELAAHWLLEGRVETCLVVAAEELDWLTADAFRHFSRSMVCAEGAGALYLGTSPSSRTVAELTQVTDGIPFTAECPASEAVRQTSRSLPTADPNELLVDGLRGDRRFDGPESRGWSDWHGPRQSPKRILGEALTAAAAWQCVSACSHLAAGHYSAARVSATGPNQQAIAARFKSVPTTT